MPKPRITPIRNVFLRQIMDEHAITETKHLAALLDTAESTVAYWLGKERIVPRLDQAERAARALNISVEMFIAGLLGLREAS